MTHTQFKITGMHCASCAVNIESELGKQPGVKSANINYALASAAVEHDEAVMDHDLHTVVKNMGYSVATGSQDERPLKNSRSCVSRAPATSVATDVARRPHST